MTPETPQQAVPTDLRDELVRRIEANELELPLLPTIATQVLELAGDESVDAKSLADLVESDPSLAGNVLRVANSAVYAPVEPIVSLHQAVGRLGLRTVGDIAVSVAVQGRVFHAPGHEDVLADLWRHAALAGAWAREIARARRRNVEGAFLTGLLHDIGRPVVLQAVVDADLTLRQREAESTAMLMMSSLTREVEDALGDEFHQEVGARTLEAWGLPDWLVAAARSHHRPADEVEHAEHAHLARLADDLAHATMAGTESAENADQATVEALGLYGQDVDELWEKRETIEQTAQGMA